MRNTNAVELEWNEVCAIVSKEIEETLGLHIQCKIKAIENSFWSADFIGYRLSLPKLCQLLQAVQATPEDWENELPEEGEVNVGGIGMVLAEKLVARHLHLTWEHRFIAEGSLWLVDVSEDHSC